MIELRLPSFGADMDDAAFVQWNVEDGQPVAKGAIVCVVETQKGAIDVEAWEAGTLARRFAEPGQRLPVGRLLAVFAAEGEDWHQVAAHAEPPPPLPGEEEALAPAAAAAPGAPPAVAPSAAPAPAGPPRVSPAARRRAEALGVELATLVPATPGAAITLEDVERAAAKAGAGAAPTAAPSPLPTPAEAMRAAIAAAMSRSKREIPHYYLSCEIDVERALRWLEDWNAARPVTERALFAALALRAIGRAMRGSPSLNGRFVDGRFEPAPAVHAGVVTSLRGGGLVVPTVHDVGTRPLPEVMAALTAAIQRSRGGQLRSSDLADSTLTVTNLGDQGTDAVFGVIYPPQVALVGLGRVAPRPVAREGRVVVARTVHATLAADHRVSDGLAGARFLDDLAAAFARPEDLA